MAEKETSKEIIDFGEAASETVEENLPKLDALVPTNHVQEPGNSKLQEVPVHNAVLNSGNALQHEDNGMVSDT